MPDLRTYQEENAAHLLAALTERDPTDRVRFDLSEPGLGKTVTGAAVIGRLPAERPVVVVAPAGVRAAWKEELPRWAPDREVVVPEDTFSLRRPDPGQVTLVGFDQLGALRAPARGADARTLDLHQRRALALASLRDLAPGTVLVADEVHAAKGARTARSLELERLWQRARARGGAYLPLSGTIDPCSPVDLWVALDVAGVSGRVFPGGIMECLGGHFGGTYDRMSRRWTFPEVPPGGSVLEGAVGRRLRRYVVRRTQEEVLGELPEPRRVVTVCPVDGASRALADRLLDAAVASRGAAVLREPGELLNALASRLTMAGDLGLVTEARAALARQKIPVMERRLAELRAAGVGVPGEPVVVFSEHRAPIDRLRDLAAATPRLPWGFITGDENRRERERVVADLRARKLAGVALTAAGQEGITLIEGGYMFKVSSSWSHDAEQQRERRILRYGQRRSVTIEALVADHPVEAAVLGVVGRKAARSAATWGRSGSSA